MFFICTNNPRIILTFKVTLSGVPKNVQWNYSSSSSLDITSLYLFLQHHSSWVWGLISDGEYCWSARWRHEWWWRKEGREESMDLLFVPFLSSAPQAQVDQTWFWIHHTSSLSEYIHSVSEKEELEHSHVAHSLLLLFPSPELPKSIPKEKKLELHLLCT
jgi:hypothetical protein